MKRSRIISIIPLYIVIILCVILFAAWGSSAVTVISENSPINNRTCIVIDAGHGGVDGGATSCTGVLESQINLEIALKLNDLFHLLGFDTVMIRKTDQSVHTQGNTIAAKKVSDLKERVRIINCTKNSVFISIHQNYFSDERYSGAQVFYMNSPQSKELATTLQTNLNNSLCIGSKRQIKPANGIYLMEHAKRTGILLECGFLSNRAEEAKLRNNEYQKNLSAIIAASVFNFLDHVNMN